MNSATSVLDCLSACPACSVYRAFSCDVIATMLEGKNNTFSLPWEKKPSCKIVSLFQPSCMATVKTLFKDVDVCQMCLSL